MPSDPDTKLWILDNNHPIDTPIGGVGATVRLGSKWHARLKLGDRFLLQVTAHVPSNHDDWDTNTPAPPESKIVGAGQVTRVWQGPFSELPRTFVDNEHWTDAQDILVLEEALSNAYPGQFDPDTSVVSAFEYVRVEWA